MVLSVPQGGTFADLHSALLRKEPSLAVCSDLVRNSQRNFNLIFWIFARTLCALDMLAHCQCAHGTACFSLRDSISERIYGTHRNIITTGRSRAYHHIRSCCPCMCCACVLCHSLSRFTLVVVVHF